jgi:amidase
MTFTEYERFDGLGLAELVKKREVSAAELVEAAIERIESRDGAVHAIVHRTFERARAEAKAPREGPLAGVPFLLKDLLALDSGQPSINGCRFCRGLVPDHDSEMVARFKAAGLIVLGRTATPELGILPVTEAVAYGAPTRNPWNLERTPGGSSGGSGAAIAAGMVPWAHASDGGGSIRIPASCCGLFGLKPTRARTPMGPDVGDGWHGIAVEHALTRSVRDSAALLDATHGLDAGAPYAAPTPERPFLEETRRDPGKLRIAFTTHSLLGKNVHPDCAEAIRASAELLRKLGHDVVEAAPPIDRHALTRAYLVLVASETAAELQVLANLTGRKLDPSEFEPGTWMLSQVGACYSGLELAASVHLIQAMARKLARWFDAHDLLLTPTLSAPPLKIGELALKRYEEVALRVLRTLPSETVLRKVLDNLAEQGFEWAAFTAVANLAGIPAMSVPLHWNKEGLPIGSHFTAPYAKESTLFRLAAQLEAAQPWADRRPQISNFPRSSEALHPAAAAAV